MWQGAPIMVMGRGTVQYQVQNCAGCLVQWFMDNISLAFAST